MKTSGMIHEASKGSMWPDRCVHRRLSEKRLKHATMWEEHTSMYVLSTHRANAPTDNKQRPPKKKVGRIGASRHGGGTRLRHARPIRKPERHGSNDPKTVIIVETARHDSWSCAR